MKPCQSAIVTVNGFLLVFFGWLLWLGYGYLPGQLDGQMASDVMLMKYRIVCARLTTYLMVGGLIVIVLVNIVLLRACLSSKKEAASAARCDT